MIPINLYIFLFCAVTPTLSYSWCVCSGSVSEELYKYAFPRYGDFLNRRKFFTPKSLTQGYTQSKLISYLKWPLI